MREFVPPRCPYPGCVFHDRPEPGFCARRGSYRRKPAPQVVPRFRCLGCHCSFSVQTFRLDYRDRHPEANPELFRLLSSGEGLRHSARKLRLDPGGVQRKFRKLARGLARLHDNLLRRLPAERTLLYDELETFETRSIWRVGVGVLIDRESRFVLDTTVASIRRRSPRGTRRRQKEEQDELQRGPRPDQSREQTKATFERLAKLLGGQPARLLTDQKGAYLALARECLEASVVHLRTSGKLARDHRNPLAPINHVHTTMRERNARLHWRSWLHSKKRQQLGQQLVLERSWRNFCWRRFNRDPAGDAPAVLLGLVSRPVAEVELLAWRQDWGLASIHPLSPDGSATVAERL